MPVCFPVSGIVVRVPSRPVRPYLSPARRGRDVTNGFLHDSRAQISGGWLLYELGVSIVLVTVMPVEFAFRGVLLGSALRLWGPWRASLITSALFGPWHVLPILHTMRDNHAVAGAAASTGGQVLVVLGSESTSPPPDGTGYEGRAAVAQAWGDLLASTPKARFAVGKQFSDGSERAVVRWRYDWGEGHCAAYTSSGSEMASSPKAWPTSRGSATAQQTTAPCRTSCPAAAELAALTGQRAPGDQTPC